MHSYRSFFHSLNVEQQEDKPPAPSGAAPMHMLSNSDRNELLRANNVNTQPQNQSSEQGISHERMAFLEANGVSPPQTTTQPRTQQQTPTQSEFEQNRTTILRNIYGASRNYSLFFSTLRSQLSKWSADEAADIVGATMNAISRNVNQLDASAEDADGGQFKTSRTWLENSSTVREQFDRAVANLSGVMQKISGSATGRDSCGTIGNQITRLISTRDDIGRWDEALGNTLVNGDFQTLKDVKDGQDVDTDDLGQGSTILATQVVGLLNHGQRVGFGSDSDRDKANDILENIEKGAELLREANDKLTERTISDNALIQINVANWGAFATEDELKNAIAAQKDSHGTFDQMEAMAGNTLQIFDQLNTLTNTLPDNDLKGKLSKQVNQYIDTFSDSVSMTQSGSSAYEEIITDWELNSTESNDDKDDSLIGKVLDKTTDGTKSGKKALELLVGFYVQEEMTSLLNFAVAGNNTGANRVFTNLIQKSGRLGIDEADLSELSTSFAALKNANDPEAALADFNDKINKVKAFDVDTRIGRNLKLVGLALATTNFVQGLTEHDGIEPEAIIYSAADAIGVGKAGLAILRTNATWKTTMEGGLNTAGKALGGLTLGISVGQTIGSIDDGDWTGALVGGIGVVSGALGLLGMTGPGFAVGLAAMAISFQLSRIEASNILETEHTEAFLQELGIPEEVTHHLRNADSGGRSIGRALQGLMEMSGSNPQAFVQALASLTPAQANDLAEASHGVDPNNDNVLPATDEYAAYAGLSREELKDQGINENGPIYFTYTRPHSLEGLRNYIVRQGISLPVGLASQ